MCTFLVCVVPLQLWLGLRGVIDLLWITDTALLTRWSRVLDGSLTILCRRLPPRRPRLPPVLRRWLKSVWSWSCWGEPESAEEGREDWPSVIKKQNKNNPIASSQEGISPAALCWSLSPCVSGDLRTASGPPGTPPQPRWTASPLEDQRIALCYSRQVCVFQTTWPRLATLKDPRGGDRASNLLPTFRGNFLHEFWLSPCQTSTIDLWQEKKKPL